MNWSTKKCRVLNVLSLPARTCSPFDFVDWTNENRPAVHLFVDATNLNVGAQGKEYNPALRINPIALTQHMTKSRDFRTLVVAGTAHSQSACDTLKNRWDELMTPDVGYVGPAESSVHFIVRPHGTKENAVDEIIIGAAALKVVEYSQPQTMVLLTGDGNANGGGNNSSFRALVKAALSCGWTVELWSWQSCLSDFYLELRRSGDNIQINYLDTIRDDIVFYQTRYTPVYDAWEDSRFPTYRTVLCDYHRSGNRCPHGDRCRFAHGIDQLRAAQHAKRAHDLRAQQAMHTQQAMIIV